MPNLHKSKLGDAGIRGGGWGISVLWLLGSLCSLYRIPFDPKLVEQDFPPSPSCTPCEAFPTTPVLILKMDGQKLLYFRAGNQSPETICFEEAATQFEPELILASGEASGTKKEGEISDDDIFVKLHDSSEIMAPMNHIIVTVEAISGARLATQGVLLLLSRRFYSHN